MDAAGNQTLGFRADSYSHLGGREQYVDCNADSCAARSRYRALGESFFGVFLIIDDFVMCHGG